MSAPESAVERWERRTEWPLAVLAAVFLVAYSYDVIDTHLDSGWHAVCREVDYAVWVIFVGDYVCRLALARDRLRYWWRHLADLAIIALPVLRPLRLLRLVMLLRVLNRRATGSLRGRVVVYVLGATLLLVFCAALAVLDAERRHPGANITDFGNALWWAMTTVTTVGYGDRYPVSTEGRFVAAGLMIGGIALIGVVTASFATWLIDRVRAVEVEAQAATVRDVRALHDRLEQIEAQLSHLITSVAPTGPASDQLGRNDRASVSDRPDSPSSASS